VIDFSEKPKGDELAKMRVDTTILGLSSEQAQQSPIASMGIYVFKREVLSKLLRESLEQTDFGKEIIPAAANDYNVQAYLFNGYWNIGIEHESNLATTQPPLASTMRKPDLHSPRYLPQ